MEGVGLDVNVPPQMQPNRAAYPKALINYVPESKLREQEDQKILDSRPQPEPVTGLVAHIRGVFERHKTGRLDIEQKILKTQRRINRIYEADKLQAIRSVGDPEVYTGHTTQAVSDAEAWIVDIINPDIDRTWDIEPTPIADMPGNIIAELRYSVKMAIVEEVMGIYEATGQMPTKEEIVMQYKQMSADIEEIVKVKAQRMAEEKSYNMELKIRDQLTEGGWVQALKACISDMCNFQLCCLKGPIFRMAKVPVWKEDSATGEWSVDVVDQIRPEFNRVNPLDWYPASDSIKAGDGDEIELEHVNRSDFQGLIGVPGYKTDVILEIMKNFPTGYREMTIVESDRFLIEKQSTAGITDQRKYDIVNFWGAVPGQYLLQWGMTKEQIPNPDIDYKVNAKIVASQCIKAVLNPDPLGRHPYNTTSYRKKNDSQHGECPGDMMEPVQDQLNLAARALAKNLAWASAPVFELDNERCNIPGEVTEVWPGKTILSKKDEMNGGPAVRMYDIPNKSLMIIRVIEKLESIADNTVVPSYGSANKGGPAGRTAAGLSMLRTDSARKLKLAIQNLDLDIIMPVIERLHMYNMKFLKDPSIKGDSHAKARGVMSVIAKEQIAIRRQEYLQMVLGSDVLKEIHGKKGIAYMAGEATKSAEMPIDKAIPNMADIEKESLQPTQPMPQLEGPEDMGQPGTQPMGAGKIVPVRRNLDVAGAPMGGNKENRIAQ